MRLTFLGTGTSSGVPAIGCLCAVCTSTDSRDARLRTSAALRWTDPSGRDRTLLLDAGPDLRAQALRERLTRCDAIFFTHNHVDHTFGLDEVRRFNVMMGRETISIYAEEATMAHLRRVYTHIFERDRNVNDSFVASLIPWTITEEDVRLGRAAAVHGLDVTPIRLLHGRLPILGFRFDRAPGFEARGGAADLLPLAYCTDVSAIPSESWKLLRGVKTLVLDALRHRKHPTHFTLDEAINAAVSIGADRTYFVHMSHDLGHEATQATLPEGMFLAHDGLTIGSV
jgi:phosphoribosyl 1,2-cyclic phosphate phosphodiesterase